MTILLRRSLLALLLCSAITWAGCGGEPDVDVDDAEAVEAVPDPAMESEMTTAVAQLTGAEGTGIAGMVEFTEVDGGVRVNATVNGLEPGEHGFHVHETGDCSAADFTSAGGHYAPEGSPHGAPTDPRSERHMGDLGNIEAGSDGTATYERVDSVLELEGPNSIIGKAVIVHGGADDLTSQPSGAAGPRVACGIIEATM